MLKVVLKRHRQVFVVNCFVILILFVTGILLTWSYQYPGKIQCMNTQSQKTYIKWSLIQSFWMVKITCMVKCWCPTQLINYIFLNLVVHGLRIKIIIIIKSCKNCGNQGRKKNQSFSWECKVVVRAAVLLVWVFLSRKYICRDR